MPIRDDASGKAASTASTTNDAKYRPAASRKTVTLDGSDGRSRDQRTRISPIFARCRPWLRRTENPLRVSLIACRESLRDLERGAATRGPFRRPVTESKKFR
jgi:hypothetical protein